jgi:hypothetical protein
MMLRELFSKVRTPLMEGGNIWDECEPFDQSKAPQIEAQLERYLRGTGLKVHRIGSGATPTPGVMSGDLDVMVDLDTAAQFFNEEDPKKIRINLEKYLNDKGLETKRIAVTVHIKLPFGSTCHQVDVKVVRNAANVHKFHVHQIPQGSSYKGVHKQMIMNALASSQNMLWSPDEGLYARDQQGKKADLISTDLDEIARYLIGPRANARSLGSVESIMAALPDAATRQKIYSLAAGGQSWKSVPLKGPEQKFFEAAAPAIGRKYQHIEDLVFTNGSQGGLHAVERMRHMTGQGGNIELKWDGSPVVYWGKQDGVFMMIPKNAWDYLKRGKTELDNGVRTAPRSSDEVQKFLLSTGRPDPTKEAQRKQYAKQLASLWTYFEQVSPAEGFIEGGLLFYPGNKPDGGSAKAILNPETQEYEFTPNITTFHIGKNSDLGRRIRVAKVMVAATGYYPSLGSNEETRYPQPESLSTPDVIVQGTVYVEEPPQIVENSLDSVQEFIQANANQINNFLSPKPGLSKPGEVLYKFYNQNLRIPGVKQKFIEWVGRNVSSKQAETILKDRVGIDAVLMAVELLTKAKLEMINGLSSGTHSGIRQTKPEGYVSAHPGTPFKNDLPGQFIKAIDQDAWAPRRDE